MSLGSEAWWAAMLGADQFEDGSLVIEDDTLDVNGGSTVNLRVKLGARPRSDVTVTLSETSSLISLGDDELTFSRDNWDTYQTVIVNGPTGNRQAIPIAAEHYTGRDVLERKGWAISPGGTAPVIIAGLTDGNGRRLLAINVSNAGAIEMNLGNADGVSSGGEDLSSTFETSGSISIQAGANALVVEMAGADTTDPYQFTPSNATEATAFYTALPNAVDSQAGTLVLRDYTLPDDPTATISLSASGTPEYDGVSGSATITVD